MKSKYQSILKKNYPKTLSSTTVFNNDNKKEYHLSIKSDTSKHQIKKKSMTLNCNNTSQYSNLIK